MEESPLASDPLLRSIALLHDRIDDWSEYPFAIPSVRHLNDLDIRQPITFFVGENGSGKSTLLEAIASNFGFGREGGSRHMRRGEDPAAADLGRALRLSWHKKPLGGYFLRSESFFNIATLIDELAASDARAYDAYGGISLHEQSHGESFLALFQNRFAQDGFYILDEPEAALSPQRQLTFLIVLHEMVTKLRVQLLIATHSPILMAFPQAQIFAFGPEGIRETAYRDTEAYQVASGFLAHPETYLQHLLS